MRGQIDPTATISQGGTTLQVSGPLEDWEDDERGAVIHVSVTQGGWRVTGASGFTPSNTQTWSATIDGPNTFVAGAAHAAATATVHLVDGGHEPYPYPGDPPWERGITLV